jgi:hypothetical protein
MKHATLAVFLLALAALPALADSIPIPPVTSVNASGMTTGGFFNSPTDYDLSGATSNACSNNCLGFEVENGVFTGRSTTNFAAAIFSNASGDAGEMFGHLGRVSFDAQTDVLSGIFGGKEQMIAFVNGKWAPVYWYTVQGAFSVNLGTGTGSLNLTKENFIGTADTPEPQTLLTLGTGLCAMAGVVRRKLRTA